MSFFFAIEVLTVSDWCRMLALSTVHTQQEFQMATRIYLVGTLPPVIVKSSAAAAELVFGNALSLELQQADEQSVTTQARLVRAATQAQAIRHVVRSIYTAVVASQDQIVDLMTTGVKVEDAGEEE